MGRLSLRKRSTIVTAEPNEIINDLKKNVRDIMKRNKKLRWGIVTAENVGVQHRAALELRDSMAKSNGLSAMRKSIGHSVNGNDDEEDEDEHALQHKLNGGYNSNDLIDHHKDLIVLKERISDVMINDNVDGLLKRELEEINQEIDRTDENIEAMEKLEDELDSAIHDDKRRNSDENGRISKSGMRESGILDVISKMEEDFDYSEYVIVNKKDLKKLKRQLDELANQVRDKREGAKQRNQDLMQFVNNLKDEQRNQIKVSMAQKGKD